MHYEQIMTIINVIEEKDMLENIVKYLNDNINHHNYS